MTPLANRSVLKPQKYRLFCKIDGRIADTTRFRLAHDYFGYLRKSFLLKEMISACIERTVNSAAHPKPGKIFHPAHARALSSSPPPMICALVIGHVTICLALVWKFHASLSFCSPPSSGIILARFRRNHLNGATRTMQKAYWSRCISQARIDHLDNEDAGRRYNDVAGNAGATIMLSFKCRASSAPAR